MKRRTDSGASHTEQLGYIQPIAYTHARYTSELKRKRDTLRSILHRERRIMGHPQCAVCKRLITGPFDMHEVLITRGDVMSASYEIRLAIHDRNNCVLIHPACHKKAEGESREQCIWQLIEEERFDKIKEWIESLELKTIHAEAIYTLGLAHERMPKT